MGEVKEDGRPFAGPAMRAKLFKHGGSQAVRLPKEFRFKGEEVEIRKEGDRVILEPAHSPRTWPQTPEGWKAFWAEIDAIRGDYVIPYPPRDDLFFRPDPE